MLEVNNIASQVLLNCSISDARHAGLYSVCGLALRLRDLYKWEKGLYPWQEEESSVMLEWIGEKEEKWESLSGKDFSDIEILGRNYDPFDVEGINKAIEVYGIFYGAGYVHSLKPSFFLAFLDQKTDVEGYPVYYLGRELARDLLTVPAFSQDGCILIRKESAELYLWNQMFFIKKSGKQALGFALKSYGVSDGSPDMLHQNLAKISAAELEGYVYHELGEIKDRVFNRRIWRALVTKFAHTPIELLARSVKDLLADTNDYGKLKHIARERREGSLAFHVAFLDGLRKELFPELIVAFQEFSGTRDWQVIENAVQTGFDTARNLAQVLSGIYLEGEKRDDMKWVEYEIEKELLAPLGIVKV
ncbi:MAG: hypothetical protein JRJ66_17105 [Deltaproteobacteria bacterium]|nr:hypothetical protein [Deltaproteobacteria bacterium]